MHREGGRPREALGGGRRAGSNLAPTFAVPRNIQILEESHKRIRGAGNLFSAPRAAAALHRRQRFTETPAGEESAQPKLKRFLRAEQACAAGVILERRQSALDLCRALSQSNPPA